MGEFEIFQILGCFQHYVIHQWYEFFFQSRICIEKYCCVFWDFFVNQINRHFIIVVNCCFLSMKGKNEKLLEKQYLTRISIENLQTPLMVLFNLLFGFLIPFLCHLTVSCCDVWFFLFAISYSGWTGLVRKAGLKAVGKKGHLKFGRFFFSSTKIWKFLPSAIGDWSIQEVHKMIYLKENYCQMKVTWYWAGISLCFGAKLGNQPRLLLSFQTKKVKNMEQIKAEKNQKFIRELSLKPDNRVCFDCNAKSTPNIIMDYGIFVCSFCAGVHRNFQHKAKGISMTNFKDPDVEHIKNCGGNSVRNFILKKIQFIVSFWQNCKITKNTLNTKLIHPEKGTSRSLPCRMELLNVSKTSCIWRKSYFCIYQKSFCW